MRWQNATQAKGFLEFGGWSRNLPAAAGNTPGTLPQVMDWLSQQKVIEPKSEEPKAPSFAGHYVLEKAVLPGGKAVSYVVDPNPDAKVDIWSAAGTLNRKTESLRP